MDRTYYTSTFNPGNLAIDNPDNEFKMTATISKSLLAFDITPIEFTASFYVIGLQTHILTVSGIEWTDNGQGEYATEIDYSSIVDDIKFTIPGYDYRVKFSLYLHATDSSQWIHQIWALAPTDLYFTLSKEFSGPTINAGNTYQKSLFYSRGTDTIPTNYLIKNQQTYVGIHVVSPTGQPYVTFKNNSQFNTAWLEFNGTRISYSNSSISNLDFTGDSWQRYVEAGIPTGIGKLTLVVRDSRGLQDSAVIDSNFTVLPYSDPAFDSKNSVTRKNEPTTSGQSNVNAKMTFSVVQWKNSSGQAVNNNIQIYAYGCEPDESDWTAADLASKVIMEAKTLYLNNIKLTQGTHYTVSNGVVTFKPEALDGILTKEGNVDRQVKIFLMAIDTAKTDFTSQLDEDAIWRQFMLKENVLTQTLVVPSYTPILTLMGPQSYTPESGYEYMKKQRVGINLKTPRATLDVGGDTNIRDRLYQKVSYPDEFEEVKVPTPIMFNESMITLETGSSFGNNSITFKIGSDYQPYPDVGDFIRDDDDNLYHVTELDPENNSPTGTAKKLAAGGSGITEFDDLENRPKYNGTQMSSTTDIPAVPTTYIKTASVSSDNKTLTLTKQDNTPIVFTPPGGGGGTTDFDQLSNRPKYNGTVMTHATNIPEVPAVLGPLQSSTIPTLVTRGDVYFWNNKAPTNHAANANTYGLGTESLYGHVKIFNGDASTGTIADGVVTGIGHYHSGYSSVGHTHDDRYYTEAESDAKYVSKSGDTMTGNLNITNGGLKVKGRVVGSGDDEGIVVDFAANNYSGICLGAPAGERVVLYNRKTDHTAFLRHNNGSASYDQTFPNKTGTFAMLSDIPTPPTVNNGVLTIQKNGSQLGTFSANQAGNATINVTVPTNKSAAQGGADESTVTTGDKYNWNNKAPINHASSEDTYGLATDSSAGGGLYGHVKIFSGDCYNVLPEQGVAAAKSHTHSGYALSSDIPSTYLKTASVSSDSKSLTLTKQDNTTITFTPPGGGGQISIAQGNGIKIATPYVSGVSYKQKDRCIYDRRVYECIQRTSVRPPTDTSYWKRDPLFMGTTDDDYVIFAQPACKNLWNGSGDADGYGIYVDSEGIKSTNYYLYNSQYAQYALRQSSASVESSSYQLAPNSCALGLETRAPYENMLAVGKYNLYQSGDLFVVGRGSSSSRANAFRVDTSGRCYAGTATTASDSALILVTKGYLEANYVHK